MLPSDSLSPCGVLTCGDNVGLGVELLPHRVASEVLAPVTPNGGGGVLTRAGLSQVRGMVHE